MDNTRFSIPKISSIVKLPGKLMLLLAFFTLAFFRLRSSTWMAVGLFALMVAAYAAMGVGMPVILPNDAKDIWIVGI